MKSNQEAVGLLSKPSDAVFRAGVPNKLFVINVITGTVPGGPGGQRDSYEVLKDGQRLLLNSSPAVLDIRPSITVVLNRAAGLEKWDASGKNARPARACLVWGKGVYLGSCLACSCTCLTSCTTW
jgi:hypothetical protein